MSALEQPYKPHRPPLEDLDPLTDEQRAQFLEILTTNPGIGNIAALRRLELVNPHGYAPTRGQLRRLLEAEEDLAEEAREARGHVWAEIEDGMWQVAKDPDHKDWRHIVQMLAFAHGGRAFRKNAQLEVEHSGNVTVEHERRLTLDDLAAFARTVPGYVESTSEELPAPRAILPAPEDG